MLTTAITLVRLGGVSREVFGLICRGERLPGAHAKRNRGTGSRRLPIRAGPWCCRCSLRDCRAVCVDGSHYF